MTAPLHVLFVCTANICRSAYAQVRAESLTNDASLAFSSAGTWGFDAHPMDDEMAAQARARGIDASGFRSRRLDHTIAGAADLILTATREHRSFVLEEWPAAVRKTFTLGQFAEAMSKVSAGVAPHDLAAAVRASRVAPTAQTDLNDPYRRGIEAAAACAEQIDAALALILPRLTA